MRQLTHTSSFSVVTTITMTFNGDNNADNSMVTITMTCNGDNNADKSMVAIMLTMTKCCQNRVVNSHCPHSQR